MGGGFADGDVNWFAEGKLNVCYNCLDKHLLTRGDQKALVWEGDEIGLDKSYTYNQLAGK